MPSAMADATVATPPLDLTSRRRARPAALSNANANAGRVAAAAVLSDANANAGAGAVAAAPNKPKPKAVASRYFTPSSKPTSIASSAASPAIRPRPAQPNAAAAGAAPSCASATTTTRTLAVAFQSPTYSLETSRARSASPAATPEKKTSGTTARAKVFDASQNTYRWPASAIAPPCVVPESPESSASSKKESGGGARPAAFHGARRRASVDGANDEYLLALSSDTDSASSGGSGDGTAAPRRSVGSVSRRPSPRSAMSSSARFTRDAMGTHSDRFTYAAKPLQSRTSATSPAPAPVKKRSLFNGFLSSPFGRASVKQPPASKPVASSFRRTASRSPARRSTDVPASAGNMQARASTAGCGFDGDTRLKPPAAMKAEEEHQLKVLYTRELQWRFANAQAGATLSLQTAAVEKSLSGAWIAILRTRKSVALRKMKLQLLRNNSKLMAVLRGQMKYLQDWSFLERDHAHSLSGATQALNATILRLPVSNGAMADIQGIENALCSAAEVMRSIGNSTSTQLPKLAQTNVLASQLSRVFIREYILIEQCRDLLSTLASMHVKYSSLQGQRIQLNQRRLHHFQ